MAATSSFSPRNVELNDFLFAAIGDEKSGMVLTVASALARLGFDPWNEAGRLADLPRIAAAKALARMIAQLPAGDWQISDLSDIAARLTQLLPAGAPAVLREASSLRPSRRESSKKTMMWIVGLGLLVGAVYMMTRSAEPRLDFPPAPTAAAPSPPLQR
jgi:hypothetical protein